MNNMISDWVVRLHQKKVKYLYGLIAPFLKKGGKIMDLGCGSGELTKKISDLGFQITAVDVVNKVKVAGVEPVIYDGKKLPFGDKEFDQVLLITVLHHVPEYRELLKEVGRVSREVIIVEDVFENWWDRVNIWFWDSLLNLEFFGHPHNNKNDEGWKRVFRELGWKLREERQGTTRELIYAFKQRAYWLATK